MLHECVLVLAKYPALLIASYAASASGRQCTRRCTIFRIETINSMLWRAKFLPTFGASFGSTRRFQIEQNRDDCCIDGTWFVGKGSARWKKIPRLLCSFAMEEFLSWCAGNAIVILRWNTRLGNKAAARQVFLEMLQDFCYIFVDGLCIHRRSLRTTPDDLFDPHSVAAGMPRGIGMIWTSTPVAAAMTRRLKNYGERRNLFEADYLRDERLSFWRHTTCASAV